MKLFRQILTIILVILLFISFNVGMYQLFTRRLSNNFSGATQAKMIDVERFLPHTSGSDLPKICPRLTVRRLLFPCTVL